MPFDNAGFKGTSARRWTDAEDSLLLEARAAGFKHSEIAILLDRPVGESAIRARLDALAAREDERRHAAELAARQAQRQRTRRCLCCQVDFLSQHAGNRLCDGCREAAGHVSPWDLDGEAPDFASHE